MLFVPLSANADHGSGHIQDANWHGRFTSDAMAGGLVKLENSPTIEVTGTFAHRTDDGYQLKSVSTAITRNGVSLTDGDPACGPTDWATRKYGTNPPNHYPFRVREVPDSPSLTFDCNGTYVLSSTATAAPLVPGPERTATITTEIAVAVRPTAPTNVTASLRKQERTGTSTEPDAEQASGSSSTSGSSTSQQDSDSGTETADIDVGWKLPDNPEPDLSYHVVRANPGTNDYKLVSGDIRPGDGPSHVDTVAANGTYKYQVIALRPDAREGELPEKSEPVSVKVTHLPVDAPPPDGDGDPDGDGGVSRTPGTSSSSITIPSLGSAGRTPRSSSSSGVTIPSLSPPTTEDTGFDETLDYDDLEEPGELAAEGQSIINNDIDGLDLMPSIAGAMVLVGWAAHVLYLSRLARQF